MSLLIKGMDMPERCSRCDFLKADFCPVCQLLKKRTDSKAKVVRPDCPLSEVTTPHGRLIDADELIKILERHRDMCGDVETQYGIDMAIRIINNTPTIIEAEVSE